MYLILGMDEVLIHVRFMMMGIVDVENDDDDDLYIIGAVRHNSDYFCHGGW